jgi:hypothetical protein
MTDFVRTPDFLRHRSGDPADPVNPFVGSNSNAASGICKGQFSTDFRGSGEAPEMLAAPQKTGVRARRHAACASG